MINSFEVYHWFLRKQAICRNSTDEIHDKILEWTMSGMFNLGDIFQLVIDSFDYRSFAEQYPVIHRPDSTFHVAFKPGYQLYAVNEEFTEQVFADVSLVSDEFAINELYERLYFQGFTVIDITRCYHEVQNLSFVIANQMQLKAVEPA